VVTAKVFLAPDLAQRGVATPADVGAVFQLDGQEGRHAAVVQRIRVGESLDVVDGAGLRVTATVEEVREGKDAALVLRASAITREAAPEIALTLVQALAKGDRDESAIEMAIECGADAITPWQAERSVVVWRGERAAKSKAKWEQVVRTATKQSRRASIAPVADPVTSKALAARIAAIVAAGGTAVVLHEEATAALSDVLLPQASGDDGETRQRELLVIVGPEGGIGDEETALLTGAGAHLARLGPHVMRTSTAGPVAIAMLSQRLGRWDSLGA
jgi:16S rRNA (uracil1498-N3)-methyltransferase